MPSTLPALKLLAWLGIGILLSFSLQNIFPSWFSFSTEQQIFVLCGMILCALASVFAVLFISKSSPTLQTFVYNGASICAGFAIGLQAQGFMRLSSESTPHHAFQPEMQAVLKGSIKQVLRRDSTPNAILVTVLFAGSLDAEPLSRRIQEIIVLNVIFPRNDSARAVQKCSPEQIRAGSRIHACATVHLPNKAHLPTDMDEEKYARAHGATWLGMAKARDCAVLGESRTLWSSIEDIQEWLEKRVERLFPPDTAPFAFAFLTGSTRHFSMETRQHYARAGTAHVLAVSGLHLAVLAAIVLTPLGFVRSRWGKFWLFAVTVAAFVVITGLAASAMRSGTMAILALLVLTTERRSELLNLLAFSVVLLLIAEPNILFSIGFQMSVAAVAGVAVLMPPCQRFFEIVITGEQDSVRLRRIPHVLWNNPVTQYVVQALALTLSASFAVAPVVAWHLGSFSLIAPLANLVVVPASSIAMLYTMASVATSSVWWSGAELFAQIAHQCLRFMDAANVLAARPEWAALTGRWAFVAACAASLLLLYVVTSTSRRHILFRLGASISAVFAVMLWVRLVLNISDNGNSAQTPLHIYPRKQIVVAEVRTPSHLMLVLQDRRLENIVPQSDIGLERFVQDYALADADSLTLCVTGPASMLVASRITTAKFRQQKTNIYIRTLATSLLYKGSRWFQALDSVQKYSTVFASAGDYFRHDSIIVLATYRNATTQDSMRVLWDVWQARLIQEGGKTTTARRMVVLPLVEKEIK